MDKLNKKDLIDVVTDQTHYPKKEIKAIIDASFDYISKCIIAGEDVSITNFGTFVLKTKKARDITHPVTQKKIHVEEKRSVSFKPCKELKNNLD